jgi:hypothetical protein
VPTQANDENPAEEKLVGAHRADVTLGRDENVARVKLLPAISQGNCREIRIVRFGLNREHGRVKTVFREDLNMSEQDPHPCGFE